MGTLVLYSQVSLLTLTYHEDCQLINSLGTALAGITEVNVPLSEAIASGQLKRPFLRACAELHGPGSEGVTLTYSDPDRCADYECSEGNLPPRDGDRVLNIKTTNHQAVFYTLKERAVRMSFCQIIDNGCKGTLAVKYTDKSIPCPDRAIAGKIGRG